jgi:hypothetical protein
VTISQMVGLLSAISGAVGTLFLFFGSFTYEGFGAYYSLSGGRAADVRPDWQSAEAYA